MAALAALGAAACGQRFAGGGELRARHKILDREVEALREAVGRLERHEPLLPEGDIAVAIDESLLREVVMAQLPFEAEADRFTIRLDEAEVMFRGAPGVRLKGHVKRRGGVELEGVVNVMGAIDRIAVDAGAGALSARIAVDHIGIERAAGVGTVLGGANLDEIARVVRLQLADKLPDIQIPVRIQQSIELPAVTTGPVRLDGATLPIAASVSRVFAGQGRLWFGIHVEAGAAAKTQEAPEVQDVKAEDVEAGFDNPRGKTP
jgi:hypothetical protein